MTTCDAHPRTKNCWTKNSRTKNSRTKNFRNESFPDRVPPDQDARDQELLSTTYTGDHDHVGRILPNQ